MTFDCRLDDGRLLLILGSRGAEPVSVVVPAARLNREGEPLSPGTLLPAVFTVSWTVLFFNARTSTADDASSGPNPPRKVKLLSHVITDPAIKATHPTREQTEVKMRNDRTSSEDRCRWTIVCVIVLSEICLAAPGRLSSGDCHVRGIWNRSKPNFKCERSSPHAAPINLSVSQYDGLSRI